MSLLFKLKIGDRSNRLCHLERQLFATSSKGFGPRPTRKEEGPKLMAFDIDKIESKIDKVVTGSIELEDDGVALPSSA